MLVIGVGGVLFVNGVTRTAGAKTSKGIALRCLYLLGVELTRVGTTALDHKTGNVAVELKVIVEALLSEFHKIAHMNGGIVTSKLDANVALGGFDYCNLIAVGLVFRCVQSHGFP